MQLQKARAGLVENYPAQGHSLFLFLVASNKGEVFTARILQNKLKAQNGDG